MSQRLFGEGDPRGQRSSSSRSSSSRQQKCSAKVRRQLTDRDLQSYNTCMTMCMSRDGKQGLLDEENREIVIGKCSTAG